MYLLQILVWILLFMLSYDLVTYLVSQKSVGEPTDGDGAGLWSSIFSIDDTHFEPFFIWVVGGSCVLGFYTIRLILKRLLLKSTDAPEIAQNAKIEASLPKTRESFLTCKISESTIQSYNSDELNYEAFGQFSISQLQVLLEELKFSVDEKFEEIDAWIITNNHEFKLFKKRLEHVETEISYIRHQIFILMSSNAKLGSNLCIGDVPDRRDQVETLKDLSTILAQVKKQFHEDESKGKLAQDCGDHESKVTAPNKILLEEVKENDNIECNIVEIRNIEPNQKFMILKELNVKQLKKHEVVESKKESIEIEDVSKPENTESALSTDSSIYNENQGLDSSRQSDKDIKPNSQKTEFFFSEKDITKEIEESNIELIKKAESSHKSKAISLDHSTPQNSPVKTPSVDYKMKDSNKENYSPNEPIVEEHPAPTNLIIISNDSCADESLNETCTLIKENIARSPSPKRTVRFAQEKRDVSPSKGPTWLAIKREASPARMSSPQGGSDPKINSTYNEGFKGTRDSVSCPAVDDKRLSRRSILEKELSHLERRVSPSPSRQKRRPNVRSKVADYIRGSKS